MLEGDDLVDTVQELRPHDQPQLFACGIACHDDDSVLEVGCTSLVVGQTPVIEHLQQYVEYVGMSFLNLVEQYHAVGFASHSFGQLSALVVSHISRRCTDESRHSVFLLILRHVYAGHHLFIVKQIFRQCLCQFGLAHAGGSHEYERCYGSLRVLQSCPASAHSIADSRYGFVLSYDTPVQFLL